MRLLLVLTVIIAVTVLLWLATVVYLVLGIDP